MGTEPRDSRPETEFLVKFLTLETFSIIKFATRVDIRAIPLTLIQREKSTVKRDVPRIKRDSRDDSVATRWKIREAVGWGGVWGELVFP